MIDLDEMIRKPINVESHILVSRIMSVDKKPHLYESENEDSGNLSIDYDNFNRRPSRSSSSDDNDLLYQDDRSPIMNSYGIAPVRRRQYDEARRGVYQNDHEVPIDRRDNMNSEEFNANNPANMSFGGGEGGSYNYNPEYF